MEIHEFAIKGPKLIFPRRFIDTRGFFQEAWSERAYKEALGNVVFVQDKVSLALKNGTLRGLHFQWAPCDQGKLVRVSKGSIFDVAIDVRETSPTYGEHVAMTLDSAKGGQFWVPPGFLHGFCTLEDETEVS